MGEDIQIVLALSILVGGFAQLREGISCKAYQFSTSLPIQSPAHTNTTKETSAKLVERIKYLQKHHNLPDCHVDSDFVLIISPVDNIIEWEKPILLDPENCWGRLYFSDELFHEMHLRLMEDNNNGELRRRGELVPKEERKKAISRAFHQAMSPLAGLAKHG